MDTYPYPNLTVIDETEVPFVQPSPLDNAIIARPSNSARDIICHQVLKDAIEEQFKIDIDIQNISQYGADYLIVLDSPATKSTLLTQGFVNVVGFTLPLIPWTTDYGSITVPFHTQLPKHCFKHNQPTTTPPSQHLTIEITGIPPHLCCEIIVRRLLTNICSIHEIVLTPANLTYTVFAYGPDTKLPHIAHIGIKKRTNFGDMLAIWPLWYETTTADMYPYPETPELLPATEDRHGL